MPLSDTPVPAEHIAVFSGTGSHAAALNYDVPLPGQFRGRRLMALEDLGLQPQDWRATAGTKPAPGTPTRTSGTRVDQRAVHQRFLSTALANGVPGHLVAEFQEHVQHQPEGTDDPMIATLPAHLKSLGEIYVRHLKDLEDGYFTKPFGQYDGSVGSRTTPLQPAPVPRFVVVETYAISSFLGDYGLGRTVKTMTLLPGEQVTMRFRTWRSSEHSRKESSSIFDSATSESKQRFQATVKNETTDKRTQTSEHTWEVEANAEASWGWGKASVSAGGSGEYHAGREQFSRQVNDATQEHARESSHKRETSVSSSSETTERSEDEETTERVIRNVNLRRTLNFVFRELNQTFHTYVHLMDVKVAYTDGTPGSWREVPLSGLRGLLQEVLTGKVDETASQILDLLCTVFDDADQPHNVLERFTWNPATHTWDDERAPAREADGTWAPPTKDRYYRYKRGPISTVAGDGHQVDGVVMRRDRVVLRTDSVLVEALLGQADALDEFTLVDQRADVATKLLANERTSLVNGALAGLAGQERLDAYAAIVHGGGVGTATDDEPVPVPA